MHRSLIALGLIVTLLLSGCTKNSPPPEYTTEPTPNVSAIVTQTSFSLPYYPNASLHPIISNNRANLILSNLVYQCLFELDNTFTPHEVLCSGFSVSEDGLTWTFTLGSSFFSDGSPVTANDVVSSLELARTSDLYAGRLSDVLLIAADTEQTVSIVLAHPNGALPCLLDIPIIRDPGDGSMPLGTGAYTFVEDNGPLRLARSASAPKNVPREILLTPIETADDMIYAFDSGEASLVVSDLTGANALGYSSGYEIFDYPTTTLLYVGFQTKTGPCREPLVRHILSRSFDRDTVAISLLAGHASATCLPFSPLSALHSAKHEVLGEYDSSVGEELEQIGYSADENGQLYKGRVPLSLTFVVNTDNSFKLAVAEYLSGQLAELGISVDLQKLAWDDYLSALDRGAFDLYLGEVSLTADFDLSALIGTNGTLNYGNYSGAEMDSLLTQLHTAAAEDRPRAAAALLDYFQSETPLAPLCFKKHAVLTQWKSISGLTPTRQNPFYNLESLRFSAAK